MRILIILLLCLNVKTLVSQPNDAKAVVQLLDRADSLFKEGSYVLAENYFQNAANLAQEAQLYGLQANALNGIAQMQWRMYRLDEARETSIQALAIYADYTKSDSMSIMNKAMSHNSLGIIHGMRSEFSEAIKEFNLVIKIGKEDLTKTKRLLGIAHHNIGRLYTKFGNADSAIYHYENSVKYKETNTPGDLMNLAETYYAIGFLYTEEGFYEKAIYYSKKALTMRNEVLGNQHPSVANDYNQIAINYFALGQYGLASSYTIEAIKIVENKPSMELHLLNFYGMYVDILIVQKDYEEALDYLKRTLKMRKKSNASEPIDLSFVYDNFALVYLAMARFDLAEQSVLKGLEIKKNSPIQRSIYFSDSYTLLAKIHFEKGDHKKAAFFVEKSIQELTGSSNDKSSYLSSAYNLKAKFLIELGEPRNAIKVLDLAIKSNCPSCTTELPENYQTDFMDHLTLLTSLSLKSKAQSMLFEEDSKVLYLEQALTTYANTDELIDKMRKTNLRYEDKVAYAIESKEVYGNAIKACLKLTQASNDIKYREMAFYYAEKAKSSALSDNIKALSAKDYSNLPDSVLNLENKLKIDLARIQSKINERIPEKNHKGQTNTDLLKSQQFKVELRLDSLYDYLDQHHTDYYDLKYNTDVVSAADVKGILDEQEALLSYMAFDSVLYIFCITKNEDLKVFALENYPKILKTGKSFMSQFYEFNSGDRKIDDFQREGFMLYQNLLDKPLSYIGNKIKKLTIIPTPELSLIPFELLSSETAEGSAFNEVSFVINDYTINYGYSSTIQFSNKSKKSKDGPANMLALAPDYSDTKHLSQVSRQFQTELEPLNWTRSELQSIEEYFDNVTVLENTQALERSFKAKATEYDILHLAMHAFVDPVESMNSRLIFMPSPDSLEDGFLHTYELFNMQLNSDMAILSACQTGYGKVDSGEGVISLARGFAYAGVPSVVMSHWKVDDKSTGELMQRFYKYLSEGQQKSQALRNAKLDFLSAASPNKRHPYYWGAFITIGDDTPIVRATRIPDWVFAVLVIVVLIFTLRMRNRIKS